MLPAPIEPMPTDALLPGEMVNICAALQAIAGHVIVDLPSVFNDYVLALIEASDEVLLVGSMDIPSIKNLKIGMQTLDLQAIAGPKLKLVLNHANAKVKLDVKEIERVLGLSAELPGARRHRGADVGERRPCPWSSTNRSRRCRGRSTASPSRCSARRAAPKKGRRGQVTTTEDGEVMTQTQTAGRHALAGAAGRAGREPARARSSRKCARRCTSS